MRAQQAADRNRRDGDRQDHWGEDRQDRWGEGRQDHWGEGRQDRWDEGRQGHWGEGHRGAGACRRCRHGDRLRAARCGRAGCRAQAGK